MICRSALVVLLLVATSLNHGISAFELNIGGLLRGEQESNQVDREPSLSPGRMRLPANKKAKVGGVQTEEEDLPDYLKEESFLDALWRVTGGRWLEGEEKKEKKKKKEKKEEKKKKSKKKKKKEKKKRSLEGSS